MIWFWVIRSLTRSVNGFRGRSSLCLCLCVWPSGLAFLLDPPVLQTVLASGTTAPPAEGSSTAAPPMDSGESGLLETRLPSCPYRFSESGGLLFTDGNPAYGLQLHHLRFLESVGAPESVRLQSRRAVHV